MNSETTEGFTLDEEQIRQLREEAEQNIARGQRELDRLAYLMGKSSAPKFEADRNIKDQLIAILNERHFVVGGKIFEELDDASQTLRHYTTADFGAQYAGINVDIGEKKPVPLHKLWLSAGRQRRTYSRIIFDPTGKRDPLAYNLWRGFGVEPSEAGSWDLMQHHMLVHLCRGVQGHYDYLIRWMAYGVQRLGQLPKTAVVLKGHQGGGKGTWAEAYKKLFGRHGFKTANPDALFGRFTDHLQDKLVVIADEAFWGGSKAAAGKLKSMITDEEQSYEPKGQPVRQDLNHARVIVLSNAGWVVPAEKGDRRFFVLNPKVDWDPKGAEAAEYFGKLRAELDAGGYGRMLHDLLALDLRGFNPFAVPQTEGHSDQMRETLEPHERWWLDVLMAGRLPGASGEWSACNLDVLHQHYVDHTPGHKMSRTQLLRRLRKELMPEPGFLEGLRSKKNDTRLYKPPLLEECRAFWDKEFYPEDWPEGPLASASLKEDLEAA